MYDVKHGSASNGSTIDQLIAHEGTPICSHMYNEETVIYWIGTQNINSWQKKQNLLSMRNKNKVHKQADIYHVQERRKIN